MEITLRGVIIVLSILSPFLILFIAQAFQRMYDVIYEENFYWDTTWDGICVSSASLCKSTFFGYYTVKHYVQNNKHPRDHPNYKRFKARSNKAKLLSKSGKVYEQKKQEPSRLENYFFIDLDNNISCRSWNETCVDYSRFYSGNCYKTKEDAANRGIGYFTIKDLEEMA